MYAYEAQQLGGLGSKLKKIVKKVEQVARPLAKVGAVVTAGMFAPALLPAAAALVTKPKAEAVPADPLSAPAPAPAPAAVAAPAPLPQMLPQLLQPQPVMPQMFQPFQVAQQGAQAASGADTKTLLMYGAAGLGALGLLALMLRRR